jgi:antitoxin YefM
MNAVTLKEAKRNLEHLVEQVIADAEATIVVTESGDQVVFLPLDEYNSWKETLYLLSNPANADHLRRSIAEAERGDVQERELLE